MPASVSSVVCGILAIALAAPAIPAPPELPREPAEDLLAPGLEPEGPAAPPDVAVAEPELQRPTASEPPPPAPPALEPAPAPAPRRTDQDDAVWPAPTISLFPATCPRWTSDTPPEVRKENSRIEVQRADELYRQGDHEKALAALERAECQWDHRDYDYMRGVILKSHGECARAMAAFERFLREDPPKMDAESARAQIYDCEGRSELIQPPVPTARAPQQRTDKRWFKDPAGGVLLAVGSAALLTGIGLAIGGRVVDSRESGDYGEFESRQQQSRRLKIGAGVTMAAGVGLITGAVIRYVIVARRNRSAGMARRTSSR